MKRTSQFVVLKDRSRLLGLCHRRQRRRVLYWRAFFFNGFIFLEAFFCLSPFKMGTQVYKIPGMTLSQCRFSDNNLVLHFESRRPESYNQVIDALSTLNSVVNDIFGKIQDRVNTEKVRLDNIATRIAAAEVMVSKKKLFLTLSRPKWKRLPESPKRQLSSHQQIILQPNFCQLTLYYMLESQVLTLNWRDHTTISKKSLM